MGRQIEQKIEEMRDGDVYETFEIDVSSDGLEDTGQGRPVIMRRFQFAFPPEMDTKNIPTKKGILKHYRSKILDFLFIDELEPIMEFKVIMKKGGFDIFAVCHPRRGSLLDQQPKTLQDVTAGNQKQIL